MFRFLPSLSMPTLRHFVKRHAWQAFLRLLVISHTLDAGQLYSMLPVKELKKDKNKIYTFIQL